MYVCMYVCMYICRYVCTLSASSIQCYLIVNFGVLVYNRTRTITTVQEQFLPHLRVESFKKIKYQFNKV